MSIIKRVLDRKIKECHECPGMNIKGETENAPGYGSTDSPVMIIGQSLCTQCMRTQIPFTGGSGLILDRVFNKLGVNKAHLFITNLVHCHPPNNRPSTEQEINNCRKYLNSEIMLISPLLIVGLGAEVRNAMMPNASKQVCYYCSNGEYEGRSVCFIDHPAYIFRNGINSDMCRDYEYFFEDLLRRFI